jgi:hypothetical protein
MYKPDPDVMMRCPWCLRMTQISDIIPIDDDCNENTVCIMDAVKTIISQRRSNIMTTPETYEKITISLPIGLKEKAHACGFNISAICARELTIRVSGNDAALTRITQIMNEHKSEVIPNE